MREKYTVAEHCERTSFLCIPLSGPSKRARLSWSFDLKKQGLQLMRVMVLLCCLSLFSCVGYCGYFHPCITPSHPPPFAEIDEGTKKDVKDKLLAYDRTLLVADPRHREPKKFGGHGARAKYQKAYR